MKSQSFSPQFLETFEISGFHRDPTQGGQKTVYFPIIKGKNVVLKLFQGGQDQRLNRELEIYQRFINLDGLPKIISLESYGNEIILFEEYIEGDTLSDIEKRYFGDSTVITELLKNIFSIMTPIWQADLVHRDIKPHNIIIKPDGKPVIIDFGIARDLNANTLTGTGFQPMTWMFASPEQYAGDKDRISYRTDFFSLGILAYYLFHGRLPFGSSEQEINQKFKGMNESFDCELGFTLEPFCREALKFNASERPRLISDLQSLL